MSLNFMIVIDDAGELKTVDSVTLDTTDIDLAARLDQVLNQILDQRAMAAGEYAPADNDTPIEVAL